METLGTAVNGQNPAYLKDPKLWELWHIPSYGSCRILSINRSIWNYFGVFVRCQLRACFLGLCPSGIQPSSQALRAHPTSAILEGPEN